MAVSDPVCEVQPVIERRHATLMCRMVYEWRARDKQFPLPPGLNVTVTWIGVPGTTVRTTADPATFRGTVETNTTIQIMSDTIPSYTCAIQFDFSPGSGSRYHYAVNSVSSTCVTEPKTVRRKIKQAVIM